jgi:hypothetical protein
VLKRDIDRNEDISRLAAVGIPMALAQVSDSSFCFWRLADL